MAFFQTLFEVVAFELIVYTLYQFIPNTFTKQNYGFKFTHVEGGSYILFCLLQGTEIIDESQDQDTTDLHKCVAYIRDLIPNTDESEVSSILGSGYTSF